MKKIIVIASSLMLCVFSSYAQSAVSENSAGSVDGEQVKEIVEGMKYKELKKIYNYKDWNSDADRYEPGLMSACSFIIPGLGQMICGEVGRGFGWFGGAVGCWALVGLGAGLEAYGSLENVNNRGISLTGTILTIAAYVGVGAIEVCSIIDASRVAKVKNMYDQDLKKRNYSLNLYPSVNYVKMAGGVQPATGLTLAMRF